MLFNPNDTLLLGQEKYRIIRFLGGGAVGDVYLATWMGIEPVEVIIKLLRDDYRNIPLLEDREKLLQAVQAEIDTLNHLNAKEDSHWKQITSVSSKILRFSGFKPEDVVRTRLFVTDISKWKEYARAHLEAFERIRPASSIVQVSKLVDPRLMGEMEAEAITGFKLIEQAKISYPE